MKIGLIAGSFKPLHAGHYEMIKSAARECDELHLYVSLSDRKRPGEIPILGTDMKTIWTRYIEPTLPSNIIVHYGGSPVANIYKELEDSQTNTTDTFVIYSDPVDLAHNFSEEALGKWTKTLWDNGQIVRQPIERSSTVNVSGTKMRQFIASRDRESFIANMPREVDGEAIWNILQRSVANDVTTKGKKTRKNVGENLIRNYVALLTVRRGS